MIDKNYILVAGYGWTGSSALVDMLKEYDRTFEADVEFRLIKDPKGISDLYSSMVNRWDALNVDMAIRDFIWFTRHLNAPKKKLSLYAGLGYCDYFGDVFLSASEKFVKDITDFSYSSFWWYLDFISSRWEVFKRKLLKVVHIEKESKMFFTSISREEYISYAQEYINTLFESRVSKDIEYIIMDQAVSAQNCLNEMQFVPNSKVIIVDRDPRDIYADLMKDGNLIGRELKETHDTDKYIRWHRALRKTLPKIKESDKVMILSFEDLIFRYDTTEAKIEEFLGFNHADHKKRQQIFNPKISSKNVGMWKERLTKGEIDTIQRELKEDLIQ